jgi:hypothetical protein
MRRREFIMLLSCAAAIWPLAARAQQPERMRRVGILLAATADDAEFQTWVGAFLQALHRTQHADRHPLGPSLSRMLSEVILGLRGTPRRNCPGGKLVVSG